MLHFLSLRFCSTYLLSHRDLEAKEKFFSCTETNSNFSDLFSLGSQSCFWALNCTMYSADVCWAPALCRRYFGFWGYKPFAPLFWKAGPWPLGPPSIPGGLSCVFFNKGNWTGIEKGELGSIGAFAKTTGNCPIFHFFSQKEDKNVHSSRAGILFLLLTAPFPVWTVPSI